MKKWILRYNILSIIIITNNLYASNNIIENLKETKPSSLVKAPNQADEKADKAKEFLNRFKSTAKKPTYNQNNCSPSKERIWINKEGEATLLEGK